MVLDTFVCVRGFWIKFTDLLFLFGTQIATQQKGVTLFQRYRVERASLLETTHRLLESEFVDNSFRIDEKNIPVNQITRVTFFVNLRASINFPHVQNTLSRKSADVCNLLELFIS